MFSVIHTQIMFQQIPLRALQSERYSFDRGTRALLISICVRGHNAKVRWKITWQRLESKPNRCCTIWMQMDLKRGNFRLKETCRTSPPQLWPAWLTDSSDQTPSLFPLWFYGTKRSILCCQSNCFAAVPSRCAVWCVSECNAEWVFHSLQRGEQSPCSWGTLLRQSESGKQTSWGGWGGVFLHFHIL